MNENTRKNYFLTESEPKTNKIRRRNNTPNTLRLDDKYTSKDEDKKINYTKVNNLKFILVEIFSDKINFISIKFLSNVFSIISIPDFLYFEFFLLE